MKKILRKLSCGLLLCGGLLAGCSQVDDAFDEIPYTRALTPLNFEAEVIASVGTSITFSWSAVSNADSYVLEIFAGIDATDDAGKATVLQPDYATALPDYTFDVNPDQVPVTVADMEVDKSYYARVRAVSNTIAGSHWAYLTDYVSTSAVRSLLNPVVVARTEKGVTIAWDDAADKDDLTSVRYEPVVATEGLEAVTVALTDEEKNACTFTTDALEACTNYKFTLLFGKSGSRGVVTAWTRPNTQGTTRIESSAAFVNAIQSATSDLKLLLAYNDGATYDLTSIMPVNAAEGIFDPLEFAYGLEIYGESTEAGQKPVVNMALKNTAEAGFHFEDVCLDAGNRAGVLFVTGASLTAFEMINCEITGYSKGIYNGAAGFDCETLVFDGVYAHDINPVGTGAGDFIDIRGGDYGKIDIKNSTFYAAARTFLRISETATKAVGSVNVSNCTFNQVTATNSSSNNSGIFHLRYNPTSKPDAFMQLGSFTLTNCVFLNMCNDNETASAYWVRLTRESAENYAPTCAGNIFYNVGHDDFIATNTFFPTKSLTLNGAAFSQDLALADGGMILDEDPCTNSIAGKMYLKNGIVAANRAGDPRWWNASEPVVVRPTELELVTSPTVWDFTEKTKFQTETVEGTTIIENIRIYGPAEIVMNEGVSFASAAALNDRNVPQNSAFGFYAQGVGAVEVTAKGNTVSSTVQIVVGEDAYSVLADGQTHKVVLGDLAGENEIYVVAGAACNFTQIAWTDDLTPEKTTQELDAPVVTVDPASLDEGTMQAVTASWDAVENAAEYEVTFNKVKTTVTEPQFVIDAATVAGLSVADYTIAVVAKPVATSTKYVASAAGEATLKIKKVIVGVSKSVLWDFNDAGFDEAAAHIGTSDNKEADTKYTVGGVDLLIQSLGASMKIETRNSRRCLRTGGGSKLTQRLIQFVAPADGGKLVLAVQNPSGSTTATTELAISIYADQTVTTTGKLVGTGLQEVVIDLDGAVAAGQAVSICPAGGLSFAYIEYSYIAVPKTNDYTWDFTTFDGSNLVGEAWTKAAFAKDVVWTVNDRPLSLLNGTTCDGSVIKLGEAKTGISGDVYTPSHRAMVFTTKGPGTLIVSHKSGSGSASRSLYVSVNGERVFVGPERSSAAFVEEKIELDTKEGDTVYIFSKGNNCNYVKWSETELSE